MAFTMLCPFGKSTRKRFFARIILPAFATAIAISACVDYENPVLARHVWTAFRRTPSPIKDYYINFTDLSHSHRLNPLDPRFMTSSSYAREYSTTILSNLMPETINQEDFWIRNSESAFAAIMWFLREEHPKYCTLPHAVSLALTEDLGKLLESHFHQ